MRNMNVDPPENAPIKNGLTPAERKRLVERHHETMLTRKVQDDLRLAQTIKAGQIVAGLGKG